MLQICVGVPIHAFMSCHQAERAQAPTLPSRQEAAFIMLSVLSLQPVSPPSCSRKRLSSAPDPSTASLSVSVTLPSHLFAAGAGEQELLKCHELLQLLPRRSAYAQHRRRCVQKAIELLSRWVHRGDKNTACSDTLSKGAYACRRPSSCSQGEYTEEDEKIAGTLLARLAC